MNKFARNEATTAFLFLAPFLLALLVFFVFAFLRTVYFSFTDYDLFQSPNFVGLKNYLDIPSDQRFRIALTNTFVFSIIVTVLQTIGALVVAIVLNNRLRGIAFFRTAYYMPSIASSAVITLIFIWLFRPTGIVSYVLTQIQNYFWLMIIFVFIALLVQVLQVLFERNRRLPASWFDPALAVVSLLVALLFVAVLNAFGVVRVGMAEPQQLLWLSSRERFLGLIPYPLLVIIFQNTFTTIPTLMLFFLAGLQNISKSMYEAASIDGATPWQQALSITVPLLRPVTFYALTTSLIGTLQMFDQVALMEGTAPLESTITLAFFVYTNVFTGGAQAKVGLASAAALILALLTLLVVLIQRKFFVSDEGVAA